MNSFYMHQFEVSDIEPYHSIVCGEYLTNGASDPLDDLG